MSENDTKNTYSAPTAGFYLVKSTMTQYLPTGRMTLQKNYGRKWFQFWEPDLYLITLYNCLK